MRTSNREEDAKIVAQIALSYSCDASTGNALEVACLSVLSLDDVLQKGSSDILLFGGEYYDGKNDKMRVHNDLYVYHPDKGNWTRIISPNGQVAGLSSVLREYLQSVSILAIS